MVEWTTEPPYEADFCYVMTPRSEHYTIWPLGAPISGDPVQYEPGVEFGPRVPSPEEAEELSRLRSRIATLESALLSKEHLDVQSVLAFEAGKREALLGMAEWCEAELSWNTAAECRRRAEELP